MIKPHRSESGRQQRLGGGSSTVPGRRPRAKATVGEKVLLGDPERKTFMNHFHRIVAATAVMLAVAIGGCSRDARTDESHVSDSLTASRGEHDRDGDEHGREGRAEHARERGDNEESEESGTELALTERYDRVRNGVRLILAYDAKTNSFKGTVGNTTERTLERVRVEVHLSNGIELGPTVLGDLKPGEKRDVKLTPEGKGFDGWTAHPEVGNAEQGHGEGHAEHDREGRSEHKEGVSD